jgi:acyl-coenzyme A thioesterase PaaI-like protein
MQIAYLGKAETDIRAEAIFPAIDEGRAQDVVVPVDITDQRGTRVVHADITMYVSPRKTN